MLFWRKKQTLPLRPPTPLNFEKDIEFAVYITNFKVDNYLEFVLKPKNFASDSLTRDEQVEKAIETLADQVWRMFSPEYLFNITRYMTIDAFRDFIVERIYTELLKETVGMNHNKLIGTLFEHFVAPGGQEEQNEVEG